MAEMEGEKGLLGAAVSSQQISEIRRGDGLPGAAGSCLISSEMGEGRGYREFALDA